MIVHPGPGTGALKGTVAHGKIRVFARAVGQEFTLHPRQDIPDVGIICAYNGQTIESEAQLQKEWQRAPKGKTIKLAIIRSGKGKEISVDKK